MRIAYGFWRFGRDDLGSAMEMVEASRELGITHFDTADVYGYPDVGAAEQLLGEVRRARPDLFAGTEVATKAGVVIGTPYNNAADYLQQSLDGSLTRLGMECVDLFYVHRHDHLTHPEEVAGALEAVVKAGKAKRVGVSNYSPSQIAALRSFLTIPLAAHQVEFSAAHITPVHDGTFDEAMSHKTDILAWSPFAGGQMFDRAEGVLAPMREALEVLAAARGETAQSVALAFILSHPGAITPIVGTRSKARLKEIIDAQHLRLSREEWYSVYQARLGEALP